MLVTAKAQAVALHEYISSPKSSGRSIVHETESKGLGTQDGRIDDDINEEKDSVGEADVLAALRVAKSLFMEADLDGNGELECSELGVLLQRLQGFGASDLVMPGLAEVLYRWDIDESGTIDLSEFLEMLCEEPFVALLPPGSQQVLSTLESLSLHKDRPASDTRSLVLLLLIRDIFSEFSIPRDNGEEAVGPLELRALLGAHPGIQGALLSVDGCVSPSPEELISFIMNIEEEGLGYLEFPSFVALLGTEPFDRLLPRSARPDVSRLLMEMNHHKAVPPSLRSRRSAMAPQVLVTLQSLQAQVYMYAKSSGCKHEEDTSLG